MIFAALLLAAAPSTAVVGAGAEALACPAQWSCVAGAGLAAATQDAASLGVRCGLEEHDCWRRFLAAEGFARVVIVAPGHDDVTVVVVEPDALLEGHGADASAALTTALTPPPPDPAPAAPVAAPAPAAPPAREAPVAAVATAAVAGAVGLASGIAAAVVSADLDRSLDLAAAGRAPLESYGSRSALFFALAGASAAGVVVAGVAGVLAVAP